MFGRPKGGDATMDPELLIAILERTWEYATDREKTDRGIAA
jgi:hypothetical protein